MWSQTPSAAQHLRTSPLSFPENQQEASNTVQQRSASEGLSSISMVLETSPVMARYGSSLLAFVWFLDSTLTRWNFSHPLWEGLVKQKQFLEHLYARRQGSCFDA